MFLGNHSVQCTGVVSYIFHCMFSIEFSFGTQASTIICIRIIFIGLFIYRSLFYIDTCVSTFLRDQNPSPKLILFALEQFGIGCIKK